MQLARAPRIAARSLADALRLIEAVPHVGVAFSDEVTGRAMYRRLVRVRRGWCYQLIYEVRADMVLVLFVDPSWRERYRRR